MNKKYSYEEFKSVLSGMIKEKFDNEINIEIHNIIKNNSLELEGMVLYGIKRKYHLISTCRYIMKSICKVLE